MQFDRLKRRHFIALLGGAAAWPVAAQAQQGERVRRIGVLTGTAESDPEYGVSIGQFVQALASLGWIEGRNIQIDHRYAAGDVERMHAFAKELVGMIPDVLFTTSTPTSVALSRETTSIPIVFAQVSDPIGEGLVASFARPGGHMTGLTNFEPSMGASGWRFLGRSLPPLVAPRYCSIRRHLRAAGRIIRVRSRPLPRRSAYRRSRCLCMRSETWNLRLNHSPAIGTVVSLSCLTLSMS
jgi:hypothetical protein